MFVWLEAGVAVQGPARPLWPGGGRSHRGSCFEEVDLVEVAHVNGIFSYISVVGECGLRPTVI